MCGILLHKRKDLNQNEFIKNLEKLNHRGPDGSNFFRFNNVYIGHTRLSIIDLSSNGSQPMISNCKNFILSFNGEIYNHNEIRSRLIDKKYTFKSQTDSEVILSGFVEYGYKIFEMLDGIFSIIIYDIKEDKIVIARDPFGIKPLYYSNENDQILISSEIKVFKEYYKIDKKSKILFLSHGYIPSPYTSLQNVFSLTPGSYAIVDDSKVKATKYHEIKEYFKKNKNIKFNKKLLEKSVKKQLMSDAKIGCFFSGGIDSSILTIISNNIKKDIETYSINFDGFKDEKYFQDQLINSYNLNNKKYNLKYKDFKISIDDFLHTMDMPTIDGFNTFFVSKLARLNNAKVSFSGIGSDEIFYGYPTHRNLMILFYLQKIINFLPTTIFPNKYKKLDYLRINSNYGIYLSQRAIFSIPEISKILNLNINEVLNFLLDFIKIKEDNNYNLSLIDEVAYYELTCYMEGQLLKDSDVFGMANSIEIRVPFLDKYLVRNVLGVKGYSKIVSNLNKEILVDKYRKKLPPSIYKRNKRGFELPYENWLDKAGIKKDIIKKHSAKVNLKNAHWSKYWSLFILDKYY